MKKKEVVCLCVGTAFIFIMIFIAVLMFFGVTPFIFGKRTIDFFGVFVTASSISFTVLIFSVLNRHKETVGNKLSTALKVVSVIIAVLSIVAGLTVSLFLSEHTVTKNISDDSRHEIYVETDSMFGGWNVTLYKRYSPFFMVEKASFYIDDMTSESTEIGVVWYDDGCDVTYEYYPDYGDSAEAQSNTQRMYFTDRTEM